MTSTGGTSRSDPRVTTHDPVPEQAPLHPEKTYPTAAAVERVTNPAGKFAVQVAPHEIPLGTEVTSPPEPMIVNDSAKLEGRRRKVAWKVWFDRIVASQVVPAPGHDSAHSIQVRSYPVGGGPAIGVSTTLVPCGKVAEHLDGQSMPDGVETTWPFSAPVKTTVSRYCGALDAALLGDGLESTDGLGDTSAEASGDGDVWETGFEAGRPVRMTTSTATLRSAASRTSARFLITVMSPVYRFFDCATVPR